MRTYSASHREDVCSTDRLTECSGANVEVLYPGYRGSSVTAQKSEYDQFPPAASGWEIMHPIPDMALPLQVEEE
jgi:hypothetical protein